MQILRLGVVVALVTPHATADAQDRRWIDTRWQGQGTIVAGDELLRPTLLLETSAGPVVADAGDHSIKAFSGTGALLWRTGRRGSGPGEFQNVVSLEAGRDGTIWVADHANARITVLERDGRLRRHLARPLPPWRIVPLPSGSFLEIAGVLATFLVLHDSLGRERHHLTVPDVLRDRSAIERQFEARATRSGDVIVAPTVSDYWFHIRRPESGAPVIVTHRGSADVDLPRPVRSKIRTSSGKSEWGLRPPPDMLYVARTVIVAGDTVLMHVGTASERPHRTLALFRADSSGRYLGSLELPRPCYAVGYASGRLTCLEPDPTPRISVWTR